MVVVLLTVTSLLGLGWIGFDYLSRPILYLDPNGACVGVVEQTAQGPIGHDCGWEEGRGVQTADTGFRTTLGELIEANRKK